MREAGRLGLGVLIVLAAVAGAAHVASASGRADASEPRVQLAALFGESDEEKSAREQHEDNQDLATQALSQRVRDLEESLRQATGQNEALTHQIQQLNEKIDRQQKDFEYRLCALSAQQLGAGGQQGQPG